MDKTSRRAELNQTININFIFLVIGTLIGFIVSYLVIPLFEYTTHYRFQNQFDKIVAWFILLLIIIGVLAALLLIASKLVKRMFMSEPNIRAFIAGQTRQEKLENAKQVIRKVDDITKDHGCQLTPKCGIRKINLQALLDAKSLSDLDNICIKIIESKRGWWWVFTVFTSRDDPECGVVTLKCGTPEDKDAFMIYYRETNSKKTLAKVVTKKIVEKLYKDPEFEKILRNVEDDTTD